jgi:hypothetical protein
MTEKELIAAAKMRVRKLSNDDLDSDIGQLVNVALADLKRIGVDYETYLKSPSDPLIVEAVLLYVQANYGNPDNREQLAAAYEMMCTKIKGGGYRGSDN